MSTLSPSPYIEVGAIWFDTLGFRPAVFIPPHRHDQVDPARLIPAPDADEAYAGKYDLPVTLDTPAESKGYGFMVWPDAAPQITAAALGTPTPVPGTPVTWTPLQPNWPPFWPGRPCHCVTTPPQNPPTEQPNQVPLEAGTAMLLLSAIALLYGRRLWRAAGRFGDWFTAERGNGPDQNGWI